MASQVLIGNATVAGFGLLATLWSSSLWAVLRDPALWSSLLPTGLLVLLGVWAVLMGRLSPLVPPPQPIQPYVQQPGLALELADSSRFVDMVLGKAGTAVGDGNRRAAARLQKLDFVFIALYVLFFAVAARAIGEGLGVKLAISSALLTGIWDVLEDVQILRMLRPAAAASAKRFGQLKWFFYFATLAAEGSVLLFPTASIGAGALAGLALGALLIAVAVGGAVSSLKGSFVGIISGFGLSAIGLIGLALVPIFVLYPLPPTTAVYIVLLRVSILVALLLVGLPLVAFFTGARSLLRGFFDLTPLSLFVVALAAVAVAGAACQSAAIVLAHAHERVDVAPAHLPSLCLWLAVMVALITPVLAFSVWFSARQGRGLGRLLLAALSGAGLAIILADQVTGLGPAIAPVVVAWMSKAGITQRLAGELFAGYIQLLPGQPDPLVDHVSAFIAFLATTVLYAAVGTYGWARLGKRHTVPALCSALMLLLMLCWMLSATAFFFDRWRIPTLVIVGLVGLLTAQSVSSDHFYGLKRRDPRKSPSPTETITATGSRRVIVVAANGGGIQAGAWSAQVLYGLHDDLGDKFRAALRMISSVSGGSVGVVQFLYWLADQQHARRPDEAAARSSLDEVAWGLSWPDFLRALAPWILRGFVGRGRALEKAWCLNSVRDLATAGHLDQPLSDWNHLVASGELPGVILNATIVETGQRLLLSTTGMGRGTAVGRARVDAAALHTVNGTMMDVGIVTAARLSASFPYVTPAARADAPGPQPHIVDGGYYDNYGMATLVEWLDDALTGATGRVDSVLVIQLHGAPSASNGGDEHHVSARGWFYQALAPLIALVEVRGAGQIAHNDIELELLQQKWMAAQIPIHTVTFEFKNPNAPLSWHLTPEEVHGIQDAWRRDMSAGRNTVRRFLEGEARFDCGCPHCAQPVN